MTEQQNLPAGAYEFILQLMKAVDLDTLSRSVRFNSVETKIVVPSGSSVAEYAPADGSIIPVEKGDTLSLEDVPLEIFAAAQVNGLLDWISSNRSNILLRDQIEATNPNGKSCVLGSLSWATHFVVFSLSALTRVLDTNDGENYWRIRFRDNGIYHFSFTTASDSVGKWVKHLEPLEEPVVIDLHGNGYEWVDGQQPQLKYDTPAGSPGKLKIANPTLIGYPIIR